MQVAKLTAVQASIILNARNNSSKDERQQIKREVYANVKHKFGIAQSVRVRCNVKGANQRGYLTLHDKQGRAFQLGDDGRFNGTMLTADDLFPKPTPAPTAAPVAAPASVFGGSASTGWFRLDASDVALALMGDEDFDGCGIDEAAVELPTPHLFLAGTASLAITADGSIYRKA